MDPVVTRQDPFFQNLLRLTNYAARLSQGLAPSSHGGFSSVWPFDARHNSPLQPKYLPRRYSRCAEAEGTRPVARRISSEAVQVDPGR